MAAIYWEFQPEGQFVVPVGRYRSNKYWVYMIFCKPEVLTIYFCKRLRKIYYSSNEHVIYIMKYILIAPISIVL